MTFNSSRDRVVKGNLASDPSERSYNGKPFVAFTVIEQERLRDGEGWKDGATRAWDCTANGPLATNILASLHKGDAVIAIGDTREELNESDGKFYLNFRMVCDAVGPSLTFQTASVTRVKRDNAGGSSAPAAASAAPATSDPSDF